MIVKSYARTLVLLVVMYLLSANLGVRRFPQSGAVNWGLRYDHLAKTYAGDLWGTLIEDVRSLAFLTLLVGLTILCSMIANIEHQSSAWKMTLALPVFRIGVFIVSAVLLLGSSILLAAVVINQAIPLTIGIPGMDLSTCSTKMWDLVPWKWPTLENEWNQPLYSVLTGVTVGSLLYLIGSVHFNKRDA